LFSNTEIQQRKTPFSVLITLRTYVTSNRDTGYPRFIRGIGTKKLGSHNKIAYKNTKDNYKYEDRFLEKKENSSIE
jgi:hypothetical protein